MILLGDCLDRLKELKENSVDAVVTDPPYGLKFMGKKWDYDVPSQPTWREVLRVLKPGGHLLSFGGTRTYHRMVVEIENAGFEIRDQIIWLYGSGFPKSHNGDHGGTALKPANEPIVLARKPLSEKTVAANFLKWGVGGLNIDESRIASSDPVWAVPESDKISDSLMCFNKPGAGSDSMFKNKGGREGSPQGRWPANLLLDETAAQMLDEQSGNVKSAGNYKSPDTAKEGGNGMFAGGQVQNKYANQSGGASRFFYVAKASKRERNAGLEGMPEVDAGIGDERPSGQSMQRLDGRDAKRAQNHHPTVKPIKLMEYLIKLITPPGGTILDPFCGSGSTGVAAFKNGLKFIGIELDQQYAEIAEKRIEAAQM